MKLDSEFYRLPLLYDVEQLTAEVKAFDESDWMPHPQSFIGNASIPLVSVNGEKNDLFNGAMQPTNALGKCRYIQQILTSFNEVFGRSRLMRLGGGAEVPIHSDINYHWYSRVRIHIPIITFPEVEFYCGDKSVHMAAGEAWIFNSWEMHRVNNPTKHNRIHLVIDTAGSSNFWNLIEKSDQPHNNIFQETNQPTFLEFNKNAKINVKTENYSAPDIMSPGELSALCNEIIEDANSNQNNKAEDLKVFENLMKSLHQDWRALWLQFGTNSEHSQYLQLVQRAKNKLTTVSDNLALASNLAPVKPVCNARILNFCIAPSVNSTTQKLVTTSTKQTTTNKLRRNDPCHCGSGIKYKKCHGR